MLNNSSVLTVMNIGPTGIQLSVWMALETRMYIPSVNAGIYIWNTYHHPSPTSGHAEGETSAATNKLYAES